MVRLLLEAGASPLAENEHGKPVLEMAREAKKDDIEALLVAAIDRPRAAGDTKIERDEL